MCDRRKHSTESHKNRADPPKMEHRGSGSLPYRKPSRQQSRQMSVDPHNEINVIQDHYIGIDVGTGSARACIMNKKGDIVGLASENIGLWQPETGYYVS